MNATRASAPLSFLAGLGAGIAVAIFLAPRSGAATRRLIGRKVENGEDWVKDKATAPQEYARGCVEERCDRVKEVAEVIGRG
jgi:gas vesicle protein